jgi:hypothetical protein
MEYKWGKGVWDSVIVELNALFAAEIAHVGCRRRMLFMGENEHYARGCAKTSCNLRGFVLLNPLIARFA